MEAYADIALGELAVCDFHAHLLIPIAFHRRIPDVLCDQQFNLLWNAAQTNDSHSGGIFITVPDPELFVGADAEIGFSVTPESE